MERLSSQIQPSASIQLRPWGKIRALPVVLGSSVRRELVRETLGFGSRHALPPRLSAPPDLSQTAHRRTPRKDFHGNIPSVLPSISVHGELKTHVASEEGQDPVAVEERNRLRFERLGLERRWRWRTTKAQALGDEKSGDHQLRRNDVGAFDSRRTCRSRASATFKPNGGVEDYSDVEVDVAAPAAKMAMGEKEREEERNSPG
ncbi:hypothetical protein FRC01_006359 [Tulasnella sp. 417]|nr:hypothetical protein FRC01_006359 [Tulasnella sp. 417]